VTLSSYKVPHDFQTETLDFSLQIIPKSLAINETSGKLQESEE
jgi:hypothetical protein